MTSHPPQQCCTIGVKHEGEATGTIQDIAGISTYIALPPSNSNAPTIAILLLTDIFGHQFPNNQLIADQYALNGYLTLMPDLFHGDAIPIHRPADFDMDSWRKKHAFEHVDPIVRAMIGELKGPLKARRIGGVGYCFGAKFVTRFLTGEGGLEAGFVAHPSWVTAREVGGIEGPLCIAAAEIDGVFPPEKRHETEVILKESGYPYQITLYSGVSHGFAVRGDLSNRQVLFAKEQAFYQAIAWFDEYIKK
ncbi:hypothetical protein EG328_004556 [Venturia inaequalis]|uniref:Dienelactone hydrolase domain-containing protein n=1 Tax=Venturia inaequalis TaxID=5025 RepID=A0A8H3VBI3_VENIN|nr:hypothetical protein EG328_004556 [Venturia inaequalis]